METLEQGYSTVVKNNTELSVIDDKAHLVFIQFIIDEKDLENVYDLSMLLFDFMDKHKKLVLMTEMSDRNEGSFFFYGKSAELLFKKIRPKLQASPLMENATVHLRFG
jgi:hypothetical protein